ncbi:MogA/MoaB family molybdenum cofactor biosynthesis protein [Natronocalculus amylovorans]|uniref:MogA/MoaB family molybdenum cofactor biosynthesis protein n=1 Tax=Natronocalculus amylovorans TaxID=2917812 RepID=A0AAE3FX14_9EURY|nr:MogA/MoaB family molybdenum cofactor biosynthesis protein [Natronocalculus amylovorans]MCL9816244.1 MogA/MoaB family molybdenum cofactor biosynthesis protein [Natronocalculus amylovorans]
MTRKPRLNLTVTPPEKTLTETTAPVRRTTDEHGHAIVRPLQVGIITVSSSRHANAAESADPSGDRIIAILQAENHRVVNRALVPDRTESIQQALDPLLDDPIVDLVITTGGTGPTIDDVTPDAVRTRLDRELPGFGEAFRYLSFEEIGVRTVSTRAAAGIARDTPVFVLPGSKSAVTLAVESIICVEAPHLVGLATRHKSGQK